MKCLKKIILILWLLLPNICFSRNFVNEIYLYDDLIIAETKRYQMNPEFIYSIIKAESDFNEKALSPKGASGLMQLMPFTAKRFGVTDPDDPRQNLKAGIKYFDFLMKRYGDVNYAIAAYNAGEGAVDKYRGIPPYRETMLYVKIVKNEYRRLTGLTLPDKGLFWASK